MTNKNHWTKTEDGRLLEEWPKRSVGVIAHMLGKSRCTVIDRLRALRAQGHYVPFKKKKWTAAEIKKLLELWDKKPVKRVAKDLNRTVRAVRRRIQYLREKKVDVPNRFLDSRYPRRSLRWEDSENDYLRDNIATGIDPISAAMGRTPLAIAFRIMLLSEDTDFEAEVLNQAQGLIDEYNSQKLSEEKGART